MTLKTEVFDFIDRTADHTDLAELYADFAQLVAARGFTRFVLTGVPELGAKISTVILHTTYPEEWSRRYQECRYEFYDPIARMTPLSTKPFTWAEAFARFGGNPKAQLIANEAAEMGLKSGIAIPMSDHRSFQAVVSMASEDMIVVSRPDEGALAMASIYLKIAVDGLLDLVEEPETREDRPPILTAREQEVLTWIAAGKAVWDTSAILGISERTVKAHLEAIRRKMDVATTVHAVVKAIRHRIIAV